MILRGGRTAMRGVHRARLLLLVAGALSLAVVIAELPLSTLVHQRSAIAAASERLGAVDRENARLAQEVSALRKPSTVAAMAHADYGLVKPGQIAYALLPSKGRRAATALGAGPIPRSDLVPPAASPYAVPTSGGASARKRPQPGLWTQVVDRLAFWRSAF